MTKRDGMTKAQREPRYTESEWRAREDLRANWGAFCDADPFEGADTFAERMEACGFIRLRMVRKSDLEESFAAERGIEAGGYLWELSKAGRAALANAEKQP